MENMKEYAYNLNHFGIAREINTLFIRSTMFSKNKLNGLYTYISISVLFSLNHHLWNCFIVIIFLTCVTEPPDQSCLDLIYLEFSVFLGLCVLLCVCVCGNVYTHIYFYLVNLGCN